MSSISGISGSSNAWAAASSARNQHQAKMFNKTDADGSGGVDKSELSTMLSKISENTGAQMGDAGELMGQMDSNGDGSLSSDELGEGMKSYMPAPPTTMEFAQSRGSSGPGEALFNTADVNSDGSLDADELTTLTEAMSSQTGEDMSEKLASLDSDGDGNLSMSEFEAGRPEGAQGAGGPGGAGGPPPGGGPGGAGGPGGVGGASESSSSATYDELDTNEDGTVSEMERLAGALEDLTESQASGEDGSGVNAEIVKMAQQLYEQIGGSGQDAVSSLFSEAV